MHIYPHDYTPRMLKQWIKNVIGSGDWSIDIRFNIPNDLHDVETMHTIRLDLVQDLLGEISHEIMQDNRVNGSITFVGTTATIYITLV